MVMDMKIEILFIIISKISEQESVQEVLMKIVDIEISNRLSEEALYYLSSSTIGSSQVT